MKYKTNNQIHYSYPLISLISPDCIARLNRRFKTHYTKQIINNQIITVKRREQGFDFWNKLTRGNKQARISDEKE